MMIRGYCNIHVNYLYIHVNYLYIQCRRSVQSFVMLARDIIFQDTMLSDFFQFYYVHQIHTY